MVKRTVVFDKMVSFRLPVEIAKAWKNAARGSEMTLADFLRCQVKVDGVKPFTPTRKTPVPKLKYVGADPALIQQVARIGNNLNQIAKFCNVYKSAADTIQIFQALVAIEHELERVLR